MATAEDAEGQSSINPSNRDSEATWLGSAAPPRAEPSEIDVGTLLGRYIVVRRIGSGALGVVFAAHDPELDRPVAIKVLRPRADATDGGDRVRSEMMAEAQALARLSDPNIVAVFDVGLIGARVWLAMEMLEGQTLRAWWTTSKRSWRETLRVVMAAGAGLAAAHAAGLVHRDFKPDNVMVGADGQAKVVDFGLAAVGDEFAGNASLSASLTATNPPSSVLDVRGTPAYMSPEQHTRAAVGPQSDQFSFCVTLWEGLFGERPFAGEGVLGAAAAALSGVVAPPQRGAGVPAWLRRALERGLLPRPELRFPSMDALLHELRRGAARARSRALLWGAAVVTVAAVAVTASLGLVRASRVRACEREAAGIAELWPGGAAAARAAALATGSSSGVDVFDRVDAALRDRVASWTEASLRLCDPRADDAVAPELVATAVRCLDERRAGLESIVEQLATADIALLNGSLVAMSSLPAAAPCVEAASLARLARVAGGDDVAVAALRRRLARLPALRSLGAYAKGIAEANGLVDEAVALGDAATGALARVELGAFLRANGETPQALTVLEQAYLEAEATGDDLTAAMAAVELANALVMGAGRAGDSASWTRRAEVSLERAGEPQGLSFARMLRVRGVAHRSLGELDLARRDLEESLAITSGVAGPDHPEVVNALVSLANVMQVYDDSAAARALLSRGEAIVERNYGPKHPLLIQLLNSLASLRIREGDYSAAQDLQLRALDIVETSVGPTHHGLADALVNLATTQIQLRRPAAALVNYRRALGSYETTLGVDHTETAVVWTGVADAEQALGNSEAAMVALTHALRIAETAGAAGEDDLLTISAIGAEILGKAGDHVGARAMAERALVLSLRLRGPESRITAAARELLGAELIEAGESEAGLEEFLRALDIRERHDERDDLSTARVLFRIGSVLVSLGRPARALPYLERSLAFAAQDREVQEVAATRWSLARALWDTGGDRGRALDLARAAAAGFREIGTDATAEVAEVAEVAEIDAWLAARGPGRR